MAASTITRTTWTDDTGTVSAPNNDGTLINNAQLQAIYAAIDQLLSGGGSYTTLRFGGLIAVEGFGASEFSASGSGGQTIGIRNTAAGSANYGGLNVGNNTSATLGQLRALSSTYSTAGADVASSVVLRSLGGGGLNLHADAGQVGFYTGGSGGTLRGQIRNTGELEFFEAGVTPDTGGYGYLGVTRAATAGDLGYIGLTKSATTALAIGIDSSSRLIVGAGGSSKTIASVFARFGVAASLFPDGTTALPGIAFMSATGTGLGLSGGVVNLSIAGAVEFTFSPRTSIRGPRVGVNPAAFGAGNVAGAQIYAGYNSSGGGAAGCLVLPQRDGTDYYLWVHAGVLRIGTNPPTQDNTTVPHTSGTVVGTQT